MSLLTVPIVNSSHLGCNLLYISKKPLKKLENLSIQNFDLNEKIGEAVTK